MQAGGPGHVEAWPLTARSSVCIFLYDSSAEIIRRITAAGWQLVATKGSHHQFKHAGRPGRVTVAHPRKDLPIGTVKSIERQAGVKLR